MKPFVCFIGILLPILSVNAQSVEESFADGNFNSDPTWVGDTASFVINANGELQLNDQSDEIEPKYLSTYFPTTELINKEWLIDVNLDFSPSSSNKLRYYLAANLSELKASNTDSAFFQAYYLEIGESGSSDGVNLYYENDSTSILIASGGEGFFSQALKVTLRIEIDISNNWRLSFSNEQMDDFNLLFAIKHQPLMESNYMGIRCFFTASRRSLFYFDNFYFGEIIRDTVPPALIESTVLNSHAIQLLFSEKLDSINSSAQFILHPGGFSPDSIKIKESTIDLFFNTPFSNGQQYNLEVSNIKDDQGNSLVSDLLTFRYILLEEAAIGDLIITEIFADPSPVVGLPENEFIEVFNRSDKYIDVAKILISDNSATIGQFPEMILCPDSFLIICPKASLEQYSKFGQAISPDKWPSLNNNGDSIILESVAGLIIDALYYESSWFDDTEKKDGGYSLERINKYVNCFDPSNWKASVAALGGTPGRKNSLDNPTFLGVTPKLIGFKAINQRELVFEFDKLVSILEDDPFEILINDQQIASSYLTDINLLKVALELPLENGQFYDVTLKNISNCNGNRAETIFYAFHFDLLPPRVTDLIILADTILSIRFDEAINTILSNNPGTFRLIGDTSEIFTKSISVMETLLFLQTPLVQNETYRMQLDSISDQFGNYMDKETVDFQFIMPPKTQFNDLVISELMIKPAEDNKLPNTEYIEIFNRKDYRVPLVNFTLADTKDTTSIPVYYMEASEYLIVTSKSKIDQFSEYGKVIGLSPWISLNNASDHIQLFDQTNNVLNAVAYDDSWYKENNKAEDGGWSLEMIDPNNPCVGKSNWRASVAVLQGSPGNVNSVNESYPDNFGPELLKAEAIDNLHVLLTFSEQILSTAITSDFIITPSKPVANLKTLNKTQILLELSEEIVPKVSYEIKANRIIDCVGNLLQDKEKISFVLPEVAMIGDIIINEILYDPFSGGVDFLELYNRSDKYINLDGWGLVNASNDTVVFKNRMQLMAPYSYLVLTEEPEILNQQYATSIDQATLFKTELPSFPNGSGTVLLLDPEFNVHQKLNYSDEMHSSFYVQTDGISLERIHPEAPIDLAGSWHSAASNVGYATPGLRNSQMAQDLNSSQKVLVDPPSFSPHAFGRNYTLIKYDLELSSALVTVKIFNTNGQEVITLANNQMISSTGFFRWDGDDDKGNKVTIGYYIVYFSYFHPDGTTEVLKELVAVAGG